jgi:hypothetical protein
MVANVRLVTVDGQSIGAGELFGGGAAMGSPVLITVTANPPGGDAALRIHGIAGQTGDFFRCENSAGVAQCTIGASGTVACISAIMTQLFAQNALPTSAAGTEQITAVNGFVGSGATPTTMYLESRQTSGASTGGSFGAFFVNIIDAGTEAAGQYTAQLLALQGSTGAVANQYALSLIYGASPIAAGALGTVTDAYGLKVNFDSRGGASSAFTTATAIEVDAPQTDATHTVGTKYAIHIRNQGAVGITDATALRIEAQAGASVSNVGIDNSATLLQRGNAGFFGATPVARQTITGALSAVADAPAKAVLTSIIAAGVNLGLFTDGTT